MPHRTQQVLLPAWLLFACSAWTGSAPADPPDSPPARVSEGRIANLIADLGSPQFSKREAATAALDRIGKPALAALRQARSDSKDPEVRRRTEGLVDRIENGLDQLLEDYRAYGLPLPHAESPLVEFVHGSGDYEGTQFIPPPRSIGFLLRPADGQRPCEVLCGTKQVSGSEGGKTEALDPRLATARDLDSWVSRASTKSESRLWFGRLSHLQEPDDQAADQCLALAVQGKARGWDRLAQAYLKASHSSPGLRPRSKIVFLAWEYWNLQLSEPSSDWKVAARRLRRCLRAENRLATEENRSFLKSLELSLVPGPPNRGAIQAEVDDLINVCGDHFKTNDSRFVRLVRRGFDAVPVLIEHLDDRRLTRAFSTMTVQGGPPPDEIYHRDRVCELVSQLLLGIADQDLGGEWRQGPDKDCFQLDEARVRAWWAKARRVGEELYVRDRLLPSGREIREPRDALLEIAVERYPQHLPALYRTFLKDRPECWSGSVAAALARSSLPSEQKRDLFVAAARHPDLWHRLPALKELRIQKYPLFTDLLLESLDRLPARPAGNNWNCPEDRLVARAAYSNDPRVWRTLLRAARRAEVGFRLEILATVTSVVGTPTQRQRLAFAAAFLDDATVRDRNTDSVYRGLTGIVYPRIEVRNYAATRLEAMLDTNLWPRRAWFHVQEGNHSISMENINTPPRLSWGEKEWAELRAKVRRLLVR
jgi:hypothetical protein